MTTLWKRRSEIPLPSDQSANQFPATSDLDSASTQQVASNEIATIEGSGAIIGSQALFVKLNRNAKSNAKSNAKRICPNSPRKERHRPSAIYATHTCLQTYSCIPWTNIGIVQLKSEECEAWRRRYS